MFKFRFADAISSTVAILIFTKILVCLKRREINTSNDFNIAMNSSIKVSMKDARIRLEAWYTLPSNELISVPRGALRKIRLQIIAILDKPKTTTETNLKTKQCLSS